MWHGTLLCGTKVAFLLQICVRPQSRGQGYVHRTMKGFEQEAQRSRLSPLSLNVLASNAGALRLYELVGYRRSSIV